MNKKIICIHPLSRKVLVVAVKGSFNDWTAYIDAVEGENHRNEADKVMAHGSKLSYEIAKILFKSVDNDKSLRWRY